MMIPDIILSFFRGLQIVTYTLPQLTFSISNLQGTREFVRDKDEIESDRDRESQLYWQMDQMQCEQNEIRYF